MSALLAGAALARAERRPRVTLIGDSVAASLLFVPQAKAILARDLDLRLELAPCRRLVQDSCPYQGERPPTTLDVVRQPGALGKVVVVDVGYNDYPWLYGDDLDAVMRALVARGVEDVLWVTMHDPSGGYRTINGEIADAAKRWRRLDVVDWNEYAAGRPGWFKDDGLHLTAAGAISLARFLRASVLAAACPDGCRGRQPTSANG